MKNTKIMLPKSSALLCFLGLAILSDSDFGNDTFFAHLRYVYFHKGRHFESEINPFKDLDNINFQLSDGRTMLYWACSTPHSKNTILKLLQAGADPNIAAKDGTTPLMQTLKNNSDLIEKLLEHGADIKAEDSSGKTALHHSIVTFNKDAVQVLLRSADPFSINLEEKFFKNHSMLSLAQDTTFKEEDIEVATKVEFNDFIEILNMVTQAQNAPTIKDRLYLVGSVICGIVVCSLGYRTLSNKQTDQRKANGSHDEVHTQGAHTEARDSHGKTPLLNKKNI